MKWWCPTTFRASPTTALAGLQAELNAAAGPSTYNVFFNRPGALDQLHRTPGLPSWLLIVATGVICAAALKLESADLFPDMAVCRAVEPVRPFQALVRCHHPSSQAAYPFSP